MHTMTIFHRPEDCDDTHRNAVVDALIALEKEPKVYTTDVIPPHQSYGSFTFVTTDRTIHLSLGKFPDEKVRWHLAQMFEVEFEKAGYPPQILALKGKGTDGWLVTRSKLVTNGSGRTLFTLSAAR